MHENVNTLFDCLWDDYVAITPSAKKIHELLSGGETLINDHIALRTFNHPAIALDNLLLISFV